MNLIICYTPLQVLIAEKIIALHQDESFYGVVLYTVKNKKFDYYAQRLSSRCQRFFSMHQHKDRFNLFKEIIRLKCLFRNEKFDKVFMASLNDIQMQFILSSVQFNQFYTFDDGTANIVPSSFYYIPDPNTIIRKTINTILGNKYSIEKLKSLSQKHYTIYPNLANIISNTEVINLFSDSNEKSEDGEVVNILLGQPVYLNNSENIQLAEKVIKQFNIDYYLPHPKEQYVLNNVKYIDTPLIFEDYIAQHFSNKKCRIYTYFSSAILNVRNKNVEVISLRINTEEAAFIECYRLFEKLGIKIIDIRE